ncbi:hypothetical protein QJS10_CPA06g01169 [Acorus calamus]|uniref:Uncharacterized protein n=1 Tax=Acorus calamus TaxID=4465 RepID=A0AAV9EKF5_ACOCL|nr:hypothetical protein QJS10_CPA06g01169 [Acorus calamus]
MVSCSYAASWSGKYKDQEQRKTTAKQSVPSSDYWGDFFLSPPKGWEKDRAFWLLITLSLSFAGFVLLLQR